MLIPIALIVLSTSWPASAASPWFQDLETCHTALSPANKSVLPLAGGSTNSAKERKEVGNAFGRDATAFIGSHDGKAGLWILSHGKAYFADLESVRQKQGLIRPHVWNLKLQVAKKQPLYLSFAYVKKTDASSPFYVLESSTIGKQIALGAHTTITAKEYLTSELKEQMEAKIMQSLLEITKFHQPLPANPHPLFQQISQESPKPWGQIKRDFERLMLDELKDRKRFLKELVESERKRTELLKTHAKNLELCEKAIGRRPEFSNLLAIVKLAKTYVDQEVNPPSQKSPDKLDAESNT